jgi:hypothetical protein
MTIAEAIDITDKLTPNAYDETEKVRWLLTIDQMVYTDLIATHEGAEKFAKPEYAAEDIATDLLVPEPYAEDIYVNYLQAKIAQQNGEDAKYNKAVLFYNDGYTRFAQAYDAAHRPLPKLTHFRF